MPCDPELRYHLTDGMTEERRAVGDGRSPFGDRWRRQAASGTTKPDWSPLNQNRSGWRLCHFGKSVDAKTDRGAAESGRAGTNGICTSKIRYC
ncbi:hypothetical protein PDIG_42060 [Penicillium digitatum PHI26]|uniref:Uncharacterized protein n=2 Tax=Penicillium digitatum TaxID=36651 RepID=K9FT06_PEND2|nr:hypothetical protein PDIP_05990 [Penicillium digitatum Pd1]EKV12770.1 hypothetical protein PDIG_42060 [Penicillium digitatum PHI26]EKV21458.1 hypothetical protein PDIP_05990 [Penicillium digitatum Pd1]